jgi:protein SCO1/2
MQSIFPHYFGNNCFSVRFSKSFWLGGMLFGGILLLWLLFMQLQHAAQRQNTQKQKLPVMRQVAEFTLTNQYGQAVTLADLRGKVWLADIIFTTCPGPCRQMTREMKDIQDALPAGSEPRLVSLTTFPQMDTPAILKTYGEKFGADFNRWSFLTGTKAEIAQLATNSLGLLAAPKDPAAQESPYDLFIHSTYFVLMDRQSRMRAVYQTVGDGIDFNDVKKQILADVAELQREK